VVAVLAKIPGCNQQIKNILFTTRYQTTAGQGSKEELLLREHLTPSHIMVAFILGFDT
jgi:hypothetical protein